LARRLAQRLIAGAALAVALGAVSNAAPAARIGANTPALQQQWREIANLPDWSGIWDPDRQQESKNLRENKPP
jgi:hypothetical protein